MVVWRERSFAMSMISGPGFAVSEVSCGCRRQYYLNIRALVMASVGHTTVAATPVHVAPLPPDLSKAAGPALAMIALIGSRVLRRPRGMSTTD